MLSWARFHERSNLCDPGSLLTQDRSTHRVKIVSTNVGSVRVKRPLGSILVLLVVRGPGNPNKEIASFPIGIFRNPLTGDPRVSASETALGSRTKDEYSSMNEDVSNPTLFGGSSGEYMDSLGSVYNSSGHCSCPHTSSQTTLGQSFSNCWETALWPLNTERSFCNRSRHSVTKKIGHVICCIALI